MDKNKIYHFTGIKGSGMSALALVLHGEEDGFVPIEHGKAAYELINSKKEFHSFPGMKHVQAERKFREQYWNIVGEFLNKNFNN